MTSGVITDRLNVCVSLQWGYRKCNKNLLAQLNIHIMVDVEPLKRSRATAKGLFTKAKNNLIRLIDSESDIEIIENRWADLRRNF